MYPVSNRVEFPIRVLVVDDHPVVREGLVAMLGTHTDIEVVGEASTGAEALECFQRLKPAVIVMDLMLPDMKGSEVIAKITEQSSDTSVVVLTSVAGDAEIYRALEAGARAYLFKEAARRDLIVAIQAAHSGRQYVQPEVASRLAEHLPRIQLSQRELEVLRLVAIGKRNKEVAWDLNISEATVAVHVKHILHKLDATDRTEAVTAALRRGIITL